MKLIYSTIIFLLTLCQVAKAQEEVPPVIFVRQGATGDGSSWDNATGTIPTGGLVEGTQIYIGTGTYTVNNETDLSQGNITIQGGFPNFLTGTDISSNSPGKYPTHIVMENGTASRFYTVEYNQQDDSTDVTNIVGLDLTGAVDKQRFGQGGIFYHAFAYGKYNFTNISVHDMQFDEAAIYLRYTSAHVTVDRCNFYNNQGNYSSGGIYVWGRSDDNVTPTRLRVQNSTFSSNTGVQGGGAIALYRTSTNPNDVVIENNEFCGNYSDIFGGAVSVNEGSATIRGCSFTNNSAQYHAGALAIWVGQVELDACQFYYNHAPGLGGAIWYEQGENYDTTRIRNSVFYKNRAGGGGAININYKGKAAISGSSFISNFLTQEERQSGGAVYISAATGVTIDQSLFFSNKINNKSNALGSDLGVRYGGNVQVTGSKMQLTSANAYQAEPGSSTIPFVFEGSENTFNNTSDNGDFVLPELGACLIQGYKLRGTVVRDGNGNTDYTLAGPSDDLPDGLTVSVLSDTAVIATLPVEKGVFAFENVFPDSYTIRLNFPDATSSDYLKYGPSGEALLDWNRWGDGTPDGMLDAVVDITGYENIIFAINEQPVADDINNSITVPAAGDSLIIDGLEGNLPLFSGRDPDTGEITFGMRFRITKLPQNGELKVAGKVPHPDSVYAIAPGAITLKLTGSGYQTVSFDYVLLDMMGLASEPATYTITFDRPLPVKLQSFTARAEGSQANLTWVTVSEVQADRFIVQRSLDGKAWSEIGTVKAAGDSKTTQSYHFTDQTPLADSDNLYRLKMVDADGSFGFSRIANVEFGQAVSLSIYPNPASDRLTITYAGWNQVSGVKVFDINGKVVYQSGNKVSNAIDLSAFIPGMYVIRLEKNDGTAMFRKVVVNK
ncbi:T9SS type A sorting domain-containing protein [Dyadobacter sandarakinus]|uniref:T9SS type A sorting domain-containing protein n=1 Tax=Dyadobacter sandarakinus TaxID=2747268 RepID=A0ABX7I3J0_9BACT|nr:T9SS type A sorting domain-containing protein [Dyadobacter sandarakinus]QRR00087.1 T9SS type A sorting domain-containing protein [Dyadobacter sandarakinus]